MCERFSLAADLSEMCDYFRIDKVMVPYHYRYNIAPTQPISVVLSQEDERCFDQFRWGLVPFWAKDAVNAGSETFCQKPAYRKLFAKHRCVIPCDGFYAWKAFGKSRQPVRIVLQDRGVFGMAGIYEVWKNASGDVVRSCTLLTTAANELVSEYHNRMPAILHESALEDWLKPGVSDSDYLLSLLTPFPSEKMTAYPVSPAVSRIELETPECIEEIDIKAFPVKE